MPTETAEEFLEQLFEFEYCDECDGDVQDHDAVIVMGNWFAMCRDDGTIREEN